jgi:sugar lactone lactonase YvrE
VDASADAKPEGDDTSTDAVNTGVLRFVAGKLGGPGDLDGIGPAARFRAPFDVAADGAGHLFVSDQESHVVRRIDLGTSAVTTLAGLPGSKGSSDGSGSAARFNRPAGLAYDGSGTLFVADSGNNTIRKIVVATGAVTTFAGSAGIDGSEDDIGTAARFSCPLGLASDGSGNLFVADSGNSTIREVAIATGEVTTPAGSARNRGHADGIGAAAQFSAPSGVVYDGGDLFVTDTWNGLIRRINLASGAVTTVAGFYSDGPPGPLLGTCVDGVGQSARFQYPVGITSDGSGDLFVADQDNSAIRGIVIATGLVTTVAGSSQSDNIERKGQFNMPTGVVSDRAGNLFVADHGNHTLRKIVLATGEVSTLAGSPEYSGSDDGTGSDARFSDPQGLASDGEGNLFVVETGNRTLRKIVLATGAVTVFAGFPGYGESMDGIGSAARFGYPQGVAADSSGSLFVADGRAIRKVALATAEVTTLAGTPGEGGSADGIGGAARFERANALACDEAGNLFVADGGNFTIRKVEIATGAVTTLAGLARAGGSSDGTGTAALFFKSMGLAVDGSGNLFVADTGNNTIRKIVIATGQVTTLAGSASSSGSVDGKGSNARFDQPVGIVYDKKGNLFVGDVNNHTIRKIGIATGAVTTVAGNSARMGIVLGPLPAGLAGPTALAIGPSGELLISDASEHSILAAWF